MTATPVAPKGAPPSFSRPASTMTAVRPPQPRPELQYSRPLPRGRVGPKRSQSKRVGFAEDLEQIFALPVDCADVSPCKTEAADFDDLFGAPVDLPGRGRTKRLEESSISFESQAQFLAMVNSL